MQWASSIAKVETRSRPASSKTWREHPLGRDEDQVMMAGGYFALDAAQLRRVHAAVQRGRGIAAGTKRVDLILHERDKRRDNYVGASGDGRRHLIAERLAASGRHHDNRIAPIEAGPDRLGLPRPEALVTPEAAHGSEDLVRCSPGRVVRLFHHP